MIESPGKIKKNGAFEKLYFGSDTASFCRKALQTILKCIIRNYLVDTIEETMWEKFIFISALASATSI
jgi:2-dehydropantoate 2-reductase